MDMNQYNSEALWEKAKRHLNEYNNRLGRGRFKRYLSNMFEAMMDFNHRSNEVTRTADAMSATRYWRLRNTNYQCVEV